MLCMLVLCGLAVLVSSRRYVSVGVMRVVDALCILSCMPCCRCMCCVTFVDVVDVDVIIIGGVWHSYVDVGVV